MDYLEKAKRYREEAAECRRRAALAQPTAARRVYLRVADSFDRMVADMELLAILNPQGSDETE